VEEGQLKELYECDFAIIGGGIMGLTLALELSQIVSSSRILIVEKEDHLGFHASGRNSGVLHAGFYYSIESLKAKHCRDGNALMKEFLYSRGIPVNSCGKVVVTKNESEIPILETLFSRGRENGINLELLPAESLVDYEPHAKTVGKFIWSPETAVTNPKIVIKELTTLLQQRGVVFLLGQSAILKSSQSNVIVETSERIIHAKWILNAAGAYSDKLAKQVGVGTEYVPIPFLGKYLVAQGDLSSARRLIYPVPKLENPFLGNHLTITPERLFKIGPTAWPTLGRENYKGNFPILKRETYEISYNLMKFTKSNPGIAIKHFANEIKKLNRQNQARDIQQIFTGIKGLGKLKQYPSGIRSQLYNLEAGSLEQDFVVKTHLNSIHLLNLVSPGWTASFSLSKWIVKNIPHIQG